MSIELPLRQSCATCAVRDASDFAALAPCHADALDRIKTVRTFDAGAVIYRQGEPADALFCVRSGVVARRKLHENGVERIVGVAEPGDSLGASGLLTCVQHSTTGEALTPVTLCVLPGADARRMSRDAPELMDALLARCVTAQRDAETRLLEIAALDAFSRLCKLLARFGEAAVPAGADGPAAFDLPLSRHDLASLLGVKPESLSRLIRRAVDLGLVRARGRRIVAPSLTALRGAAAG